MANTSGEFSVVHYFDAEKNELMFVRFWVNGHEVLMPLSELVYGLKDGKDIEVVIPEDTSEENKLVNMNEVLEAIGRLRLPTERRLKLQGRRRFYAWLCPSSKMYYIGIVEKNLFQQRK